MMRYTKEGVGEAFVDIIGSIGNVTMDKFNEWTFLANYAHIEPTMHDPAKIDDKIQEVKKEIAAIEGREGMYLKGMLSAFELFNRIMAGDQVKYSDACAVMQQVNLRSLPMDTTYEAIAARVSEKLGKLGYTGAVGEQIQAFLKATTLPADQVTKTAASLVERAKAATLKKVVVLPEDDGIDAIDGVTGVHWSGFSRYLGNYRGDLRFNIERPWTTPIFGNVLCHEAYPGHQTFYCHWDHLFQQGKLPLEGAYYSTAGNPTNCMFEGAPEVGLHFLGWDDYNENTPEVTDEEKELFIVGREIEDLQRMLQTQGCYLANEEGLGKEDVVQYMLSKGIYNRIEAENSYKYFTNPVGRYYYPSYYYGRWMIAGAYDRVPREKRGEFFHMLYDFPHTNETFIKEAGALIGDPAFDPLANW